MKIAISLPDPLFDATDRLARERGVPRSQLVAEALVEYVGKHDPAAVTARLDAVHADEPATLDPALAAAQYASIGRETW